MAKRAFTLIELLVVIAIIALLIGILLPALGEARNASRMTNSLSNMRQINLAMVQYRFSDKDRMPIRGSRYGGGNPTNIGGWCTWSYGGKNSDSAWDTANPPFFWKNYGGAIFDEPAYSRPLNQFLYGDIVLDVPTGYQNIGGGSTWIFNPQRPSDSDRLAVEMPVYASPGDKATRQGNQWPAERTDLTSYDDVGTSYHINMKWFYQQDIAVMSPFRRRLDEGVRRMQLANEFDPTGKFVWIHDQTADVVAHSSGGTSANPPQYMGEFRAKNKSVMGYLDGRAEYNLMVTGAQYDPIPNATAGPWVIGKYTFIFQRGKLPSPWPVP